MDLNFPRPSLNSPAESGTAAGNAFYANVMRRAQESRERRIVLNEVLAQMYKQEMPDYEEIVRQINLCLAQATSVVNRRELAQELRNIPLAELENLLKRLEKMRPPVRQVNR
jgi:hypothetical protein